MPKYELIRVAYELLRVEYELIRVESIIYAELRDILAGFWGQDGAKMVSKSVTPHLNFSMGSL